LSRHPARALVERGVRLTVNSDDFAMFGANVSDELLCLVEMGFTAAQIERVVETGLGEMS
jgi:adenosine deaminase